MLVEEALPPNTQYVLAADVRDHGDHKFELVYIKKDNKTVCLFFAFFFFRVILAGASGMIAVGFAFLGSYATF